MLTVYAGVVCVGAVLARSRGCPCILFFFMDLVLVDRFLSINTASFASYVVHFSYFDSLLGLSEAVMVIVCELDEPPGLLCAFCSLLEWME